MLTRRAIVTLATIATIAVMGVPLTGHGVQALYAQQQPDPVDDDDGQDNGSAQCYRVYTSVSRSSCPSECREQLVCPGQATQNLLCAPRNRC
jgi:hypothetical protein